MLTLWRIKRINLKRKKKKKKACLAHKSLKSISMKSFCAINSRHTAACSFTMSGKQKDRAGATMGLSESWWARPSHLWRVAQQQSPPPPGGPQPMHPGCCLTRFSHMRAAVPASEVRVNEVPMGITGSCQEEGLEGREPPAPPCSWSLCRRRSGPWLSMCPWAPSFICFLPL